MAPRETNGLLVTSIIQNIYPSSTKFAVDGLWTTEKFGKFSWQDDQNQFGWIRVGRDFKGFESCESNNIQLIIQLDFLSLQLVVAVKIFTRNDNQNEEVDRRIQVM